MTKLGQIQVAFSYKGIERQKTFVTIKNSAGEVLIQTSVKRAVDDAPNKLLGRFLAFRKAMNQLTGEGLATRAQRAEAWDVFKSAVKVPESINLARV